MIWINRGTLYVVRRPKIVFQFFTVIYFNTSGQLLKQYLKQHLLISYLFINSSTSLCLCSENDFSILSTISFFDTKPSLSTSNFSLINCLSFDESLQQATAKQENKIYGNIYRTFFMWPILLEVIAQHNGA